MIAIVVSVVIALVLAVVLYGSARRFVRDRMRYVDAVQKGIVPWVAGFATFLVMGIVTALVPFVGVGTAIAAGVAVGSGVASGVSDIRKGLSPTIWGR